MDRQRLAMLVIVLLAALFLIYVGRRDGTQSVQATRSFLPESGGWIRISGDVLFSGTYPITANSMTVDVIELAKPYCTPRNLPHGQFAASGQIYKVDCTDALLLYDLMTAHERIVLNIPLDINRVTAADLESVPGIGPVMAKRIVEYRQNNGAFDAIADLINVPGVGDKKLKQLKPYVQVTDMRKEK